MNDTMRENATEVAKRLRRCQACGSYSVTVGPFEVCPLGGGMATATIDCARCFDRSHFAIRSGFSCSGLPSPIGSFRDAVDEELQRLGVRRAHE